MMKGGLLQPAIKCNTLFDTGANPFNYTYLYFIYKIKRQVPIDFFWIDEPVFLGDKSQQNIYLAVGFTVSFIDPMFPENINTKKLIFKVFRNKEPPSFDTNPLILGLKDICEHFLDVHIHALQYNYKKQGKTYQDDISQLKMRSIPLPEDEELVTMNFLSSLNTISSLNTCNNDENQPQVLNITDEGEDRREEEVIDPVFISKLHEMFEDKEILFKKHGHVHSITSIKKKVIHDRGYKLYLRRLPLNKKATTTYAHYLKNKRQDPVTPFKLDEKEPFTHDFRYIDYCILTDLCVDNPNMHEVKEANPTFEDDNPDNNPPHLIEIDAHDEEDIDDVLPPEKPIPTKDFRFDIEEYLASTIPPWDTFLNDSPEELESYIPCDNTGLFNYLSTSHEEAIGKYLKDAKNNTHPECWSYVQDILESELAINQFCPSEWTGMKIEPIDIEFTPEFQTLKEKGFSPKGSKAFVNERMKPAYIKEFNRMQQYMYEPSNSTTASRIVVADKATPPFVRICGNYAPINKYVMLPQVTIPNIRNEIYRAYQSKYFINIDLANGFHNMPISKSTSEALALATEWGLFQPKFMPEGVRSAPQEFQRVMRKIFEPIKEFTIVIWDNILVLANSLEEVRERLLQVLNICKDFNVILKMSKTQIGYMEAEFFGYLIKYNTIELTQERKDSIAALKFFKNKKGAQSFLGSCVFFKDFIPNYSTHTAPLHDMVKTNFLWDRSTWQIDYEAKFEALKEEITGAMKLHFPDYNKLWVLRTDCSKDALGAILFQIDESGAHEPIAFVSQKLSEQAKNWAAIKLEAYAIYYAVRKLSYYLLGHKFVIECDHANLVTMQHSDQYIIQRWRCYLESFAFTIKHIQGKHNLMADFQSRMFSINLAENDDTADNIFHQPYFDHILRLYNEKDNIPLLEQYRFPTVTNNSSMIIIRDQNHTFQYHASLHTPLSTVFYFHDPSANHLYLFDDLVLGGVQPVAQYSDQNNILFLEAIPVLTRRQRLHHETNDKPIEPIPYSLPSNSPTVPHGDPQIAEAPIVEHSDAPIPFAHQGEQRQGEIPSTLANPDFDDLIFEQDDPILLSKIKEVQSLVSQYMRKLHGGRKLHHGANRMYRDANTLFPGHRLPQSFFKDYVARCSICQKIRLQKDSAFLERIRSLKADPRPRAAVCIDRVSISPPSKRGNTTAIVISDLFTRLVKVYASKEYTSATVADALKDYIITYGAYDVVQSDPGSDILGGAVEAINKRWNLSRKVSLVDRHESNGCERVIQEILRHLRTLVADERALDLWDDPDYLGFVTFCLNDRIHSEIGLTPYQATFGVRDEAYFILPEVSNDESHKAKVYIERLNKSLQLVRKLNREFQLAIHEKRTSVTPAHTHNQLREGDLIWFRRRTRIDPDGKLRFKNKGPYRVISSRNNDIQCEHIVTKVIKTFHISEVFPVNIDTPYDELYEAAKLDQDQEEVESIITWRGEITKRTSLEFLVKFSDGTLIWKDLDNDLKLNDQFVAYINSQTILMPLRYTLIEWRNLQKTFNNQMIEPFQQCYLDLRSYNLGWRQTLQLDEPPLGKKYVYLLSWDKYMDRSKKTVKLFFNYMKHSMIVNNSFIIQFCSERVFNSNTMILIDEEMIRQHPQLSSKEG